MPTVAEAAQALKDAKVILDAAITAQPALRAVTVAAQVAEDAQAQVVQASKMAYDAALNVLLDTTGNEPDAT